ncbi:MAG: hypothetical protein UF228_08790 [Lachnospiraceae bacterium]|nr:hypothetical protein [Lachnospiraceae bacterium]
MNKKKFNISNLFNGKLFFEAFKQIRIVGFVGLVLLSAIGIFMPLFERAEDGFDNYHNYGEALLDVEGYMFPLIALIFIITPIMFMMLFNFLTKRSGSDFYHSLPVKRITLFSTLTTAILAWIALLIITYTVLLLTVTSIVLPHYIIDIMSVMAYIINIFISCLLVMSAFSIDISLTGTTISNVILSCGILIVPRIVITILSLLTADYAATLTDTGHLLFNTYANMPFALLSILMGMPNKPLYNLLMLGEHTYYTLGLAIIYLIIGIKLFVSRPSETSSKSFRNRKVFLLLSLCGGFLLSLFIIGYSFEGTMDNILDLLSYNLFKIILIIIAIALLMYALEAAYTKSVKKGLKGFIYTPFILLADVAIFFAMFMTVQYYNNETFDKDDVDYIYITDLYNAYLECRDSSNDDYSEDYYYDDYYYDDQYYSDQYYYYEETYMSDAIRNTKITDPYIVDYLVDIFNQDRGNSNTYYNHVAVTFESPLFDETRYVYLSDSELKHIGLKLIETDEFNKCISTYPDVDDAIAISCNDLTDFQSEEIYKSLISELKNFSSTQIRYIAMEDFDRLNTIEYVYVEKLINGNPNYFRLPICSSMTETLTMYLNYMNKENKDDTINSLNYFEELSNIDNYYMSAYIYDLSLDERPIDDVYIHLDNAENKKAVMKLVKENVNSNHTYDKNNIYDKNSYLCKIYGVLKDDNEHLVHFSYYINIPKDSSLIQKYDEYNDYSEYNLIEIHEDEFGNITHIYADEFGNTYEEYIPNQQ